MSIPPVACTLSAEHLACQAEQLIPGLAARASRVTVHTDEVRLDFDHAPGLLAAIASVLEHERECCRFLTFELRAEHALGAVRLTIGGPAGTGAFLAGLSPRFADASGGAAT
ncbi:MAG: hypothetical protein MUF00_03470 [Gemmatimonadaceae bacterium]|nr:hypothetical protein [Gemmatimonadaceae bacterium]